MLVIPIEKQKVYKGGHFVYKASNLIQMVRDLLTDEICPESFKIEEIVVVNEDEWGESLK